MEFSEEESKAFVYLQARMVDLLMRHYIPHFRKMFGEQTADPFDLEQRGLSELQPYRDLAVFYHLQEELFEQILPLIKRRLSFEAPRKTKVEELPAKGKINWTRTATATWQERPGEPSLSVYTRQRRRNFGTAPNLLTVVTILEYQRDIEELLNSPLLKGSQRLRHPLNDTVDNCTKELAFLQFAGLINEAKEILEGYDTTSIEKLEEEVEANILPGSNSAYSDLLSWRRKLKNIKLLDRTLDTKPQLMLGANPDRDNYLYQLWLFYEIGELLIQKDPKTEAKFGDGYIRFKWGEGEEQRFYRLQYDQSVKHTPPYWLNAPGVRPDFYIYHDREHDQKQNVSYDVYDAKNEIIWHEPGYVLDAKYYRPKASDKAPAHPVKRMIADLQLMSEKNGALLFAFQKKQTGAEYQVKGDQYSEPDITLNSGKRYSVKPPFAKAQYIQPDVNVEIWCFQPGASSEAALQQALTDLLDNVHQALKTRVEVKCHGVMLDSLTATAHGAMANIAPLYRRDGKLWSDNTNLDNLVLCPKPHIAAWRIDLVHLDTDCCQKAELCHVIGKSGITLPKRLEALTDIQSAIQTVVSANAEKDEEALVQAANQQVKVVVERYKNLINPDLSQYDEWIKKEIGPIFFTTALLSDTERNTIRLAYFISEQIKAVKANNYAAPGLLFTGIMEELGRRTIFVKTSLSSISYKEQTMGRIVSNQYRYQARTDILRQNLWQANFNRLTYNFDDWTNDLGNVKNHRNNAAHKANLSKTDFENLVALLFGDKTLNIGAFNGLLMAWKV
jgi:hypothetical protein